MRKVIVYHGTSKENAESIQRLGFKEGTWFALHLENALGFGGPYVFEVVMENKQLPSHAGGWQFRAWEPIPPTQIASLCFYEWRTLMEDRLLRELVFESNLPVKKRAGARREFEEKEALGA